MRFLKRSSFSRRRPRLRLLLVVALVAGGLFAPPALAQDTPTCSSASVDSDGDGWGWENNQSCRVGAGSASANNCDYSDASVNNGWGWDSVNGVSCEPASSSTTTGSSQNANGNSQASSGESNILQSDFVVGQRTDQGDSFDQLVAGDLVVDEGGNLVEVPANFITDRFDVLDQIDRGEIVPDPSSRLGAYAATRGYVQGTLGYGLNQGIGLIYSSWGSFGEEEIGTLFNAPEIRALYGQPADSAASRLMAQLEYDYWAGLPLSSPGRLLGIQFSPEERFRLHQELSQMGAPDGETTNPHSPLTREEEDRREEIVFEQPVAPPQVIDPNDTDGDGVPNSRDDFPWDPTRFEEDENDDRDVSTPTIDTRTERTCEKGANDC